MVTKKLLMMAKIQKQWPKWKVQT